MIVSNKSSPNLKPCPFCGHDEVDLRYGASGYTDVEYHPYQRGFVQCVKCGCRTDKRLYIKNAVINWNRRPEDD